MNGHLTVKMSHRALMTAEKCERAWDARSYLAGGGHSSVWQAASLASTTKMHLEVMNLPTDDRDWLPLAANPQKWWKLINKKLHEVSSGPEARATLPQRKRLIDKTRQDKENLRTFLPERSRHCAREARTCAGRGVDAPASSSSISGGLRNQRFETHYRSVRLTGKKVNRQTAVGLVQTDFINATIPRNSPGP